MEMNPRCEVCGVPMIATCSGDWRCPINDLHWLILIEEDTECKRMDQEES